MRATLVLIAGLLSAASATSLTKLVTFDGAPGTTFQWEDLNDPVMGGRSTSTFKIDAEKKVGIFNGTCAIVPKLKAPGFAKVTTRRDSTGFADLSSMIEGSLELRVRSMTPNFAGFRVAFAAKNVPRTSIFGGGSFKAQFNLTDTTDVQVIKVPFTSFSYDWSPFTGNCFTKDPTGQQHHCCSDIDNRKYCPTAKYLGTITDVEVGAEGAEGDFHIEISYIGATLDQ